MKFIVVKTDAIRNPVFVPLAVAVLNKNSFKSSFDTTSFEEHAFNINLEYSCAHVSLDSLSKIRLIEDIICKLMRAK